MNHEQQNKVQEHHKKIQQHHLESPHLVDEPTCWKGDENIDELGPGESFKNILSLQAKFGLSVNPCPILEDRFKAGNHGHTKHQPNNPPVPQAYFQRAPRFEALRLRIVDFGFFDEPGGCCADDQNHSTEGVGHPFAKLDEIRRDAHREKHDDPRCNHENALSAGQHIPRHAVDVQQRKCRIFQIREHHFQEHQPHQRNEGFEEREEGGGQDDRNRRYEEKRLTAADFGHGMIALPGEIHDEEGEEPEVDAAYGAAVGLGPAFFEKAKSHERPGRPHGNAPTDIREADKKQIPPEEGAIRVIRAKFGCVEKVAFFAEFFCHRGLAFHPVEYL